jgi:predicted DNA-binding transcriptional regulator AlpA
MSNKEKNIPDLRFRLGYNIHELPLVVKMSENKIYELIELGLFPKPFKLPKYNANMWDRKSVEKWWEKTSQLSEAERLGLEEKAKKRQIELAA